MTTPQPPPPTGGDKLALAAMALAGMILLLITFVIIAGVLQGKLNPTAVATMLGGMFTTLMGLIFTAMLRGNGKEKDK